MYLFKDIFLIIYLVFILIAFVITIKDFGTIEYACTPKEIYECNNFNMIGALVLFILWCLINPLYVIARLLYWVFHVGRE